MAQTKIEWADASWNPVTGCTKISPGCKHCFAERMAKRLKAMGQPKYRNGFRVTLHPEVLDEPLRWRKPRRVFPCSMSDLFHEEVPLSFVQKVFRVMDIASAEHGHVFLVLTKRAKRMASFRYQNTHDGRWPSHVWAGISAENQQTYDERIQHLVHGPPALVKWLSLEPLLGPIDLRATGRLHANWVVVGGESGPGARPMDPNWARALRDECVGHGIPFFLKQLGSAHSRKNKGGRELDGREWNERPGMLGSGDG